jgi:excisionase family DNA binding protein
MLDKQTGSNDHGPRLMSTSAAARALSISERHLRTLAARGHLRLVRLGRRVLVPREELDRIVREGSR